MAIIYSLQGQVVNQEDEPLSQAVVEIRCEGVITSFYKTDSRGYFMDNGVRDAAIDLEADKYQVRVNHVSPTEYFPKPPLQKKDAESSPDQNGNTIYRFPLKIIV